MIKAKILKDSITPGGNRLTTFECTYPRFIHSELLTHRAFSRNAASSRAIPIKKMVSAVIDNPAMPVYWGRNQSGMQAGGQLEGSSLDAIKAKWLKMRDATAKEVLSLAEEGNLHKQIANRPLEPWAHITVILTSAEAGLLNFFHLRAHPDAQPEFQTLAYQMLDCYLNSEPEQLKWFEWHLPMGEDLLEEGLGVNEALKVCTGRIARVSYLTHNGERNIQEDINLHDRLSQSGHWSPFEHCTQAQITGGGSNFGPFWQQYRKQFPCECAKPSKEELRLRLANRPDWAVLNKEGC